MKIARTAAFSLLLSAVAGSALATDLPRQSLPSIRIDTLYNGVMHLTDSPDWAGGGTQQDYRIQLNEGDNVVIEGKSEDFDIAVVLYDDEEKIAEDDDGDQGTNARLIGRINKTGMHTVRVFNPYVDRMGAGRFTVKVSHATARDLESLDDHDSHSCGCNHAH